MWWTGKKEGKKTGVRKRHLKKMDQRVRAAGAGHDQLAKFRWVFADSLWAGCCLPDGLVAGAIGGDAHILTKKLKKKKKL